VNLRPAGPSDADAIAALHADSWRRHYRGAYADAFLDGDVYSDRLAVWTERLSDEGADTDTLLAEDDGGLIGFAHTMFGADPGWGALLDNLHVVNGHKRQGIGSQLLARSIDAASDRGSGLFLWVLEQNLAAQAFYEANGGRRVDVKRISPPGGVAGRLNGSPAAFRYVWEPPPLS
jgi:ribosomal protein S18 acetylase RimI-like enzyme